MAIDKQTINNDKDIGQVNVEIELSQKIKCQYRNTDN